MNPFATRRFASMGAALQQRLGLEDWPRILRFVAAPGGIFVLLLSSIGLSLGALIYAQHANTSIVEHDMHMVTTLSAVAARFDHEDGNLYRLMADKAAGGGQVDIPGRAAGIKASLARARRDLIAIRPEMSSNDQARTTVVLAKLAHYADAVDVVSSMLDVDLSASISMLAPFRTNADEVILDVNRMVAAGIADARHHANVAAGRTRWLVALVFVAMAVVAALSMAWLALASYRGLKLSDEMIRRREAEANALQLARHDALTGLINRRAFVAELTDHAAQTGPDDGFAVMLIDLDGFKETNDLHGHAAGDAVLKAVAERMECLSRDDMLLARLGGDEFAVLAPFAGSSAPIAPLVRQLSTVLHDPLTWHGETLRMGASIGLSIFPDDAARPEALLHTADIAMYHAKRAQKGTFRFFEPAMEAERVERRRLEDEFRAGVAAGEVQPFYQPIMRFADDRLCGFEILARWQHPRLGLLPPAAFIQMAEDTGQITAMTESVLRQACAHIPQLPPGLRYAINVSPVQLTEPGLAERLIGIVQETGISPTQIEIELTEDAIMDDLAQSEDVIATFRRSGMSIALDDFGTGFSSLSNLRRLKFDKIKIDQSFVRTMLGSSESQKLIDAMLGLAASFGMSITAEGIETHEAAHMLARKGCTEGQGFLFGRPMAFDQARSQIAGDVLAA